MNKKAFAFILLGMCIAYCVVIGNASAETLKTPIGSLSFTHDFANGYPTDATVRKLYDARDFQRACQAYLWAIPIVSMAQWQYEHMVTLGAENGQIVFIESYKDRVGGLTYNATTPYVLPFIDLADGPWVAVLPEGEVRGSAHDMWQIAITQLTEPGKYLFVGPGQEVPKDAADEGYKVAQSPTNSLLLGIRLMATERDERMKQLGQIEIYPYAERKNPRPRGYITPNGKSWLAAHPRGLTYWERLADAINREPVFERDRFFMAMLKPLGIEKGKPFKPTKHQKLILTEATLVGEAMAKANDFAKRMEEAHYVDGLQWHFATVANPDQRAKYYDQLDERAAWLYEAVTNDPAMHGHKTGKGQVYLGTYKDKDGDWLDGGKNYVLHVPPDVPAELFWSITLYDVDTRCLLQNKQEIADRSSRMDLIINKDGSVDIHMGPDAPKGKEKNWIPTVPGKAWFPYFRLYSPKKAFLDRTWVLPDIKKAG
ncbi:MAG: DUF1254 domain-containing protein [Desulfobacterales bacterium]|jgi:hypothetical protein